MNLLGHLQPTHDALEMQQLRLQVIAENIAQAQTTRTPDGGPYQRKQVQFSTYLERAGGLDAPARGVELPRLKVDGLVSDDSPGERVFQPGHPDADADGFVTYPNVAVSMEMVELLQASRAYEANLQVVRTAKEMVEQALTIGR